jgi:hypothetical protein
MAELTNLFEDTIKEHEADPVDDEHPRDIIDVYLSAIRRTEDSNSSFHGEAGS